MGRIRTFEELLDTEVFLYTAHPKIQGAAPPMPDGLRAKADAIDGTTMKVRDAISSLESGNDNPNIHVRQIDSGIVATELKGDYPINCWNLLTFDIPEDAEGEEAGDN